MKERMHVTAYGDMARIAFAHDMRTPMTCVAGAAQTALMMSRRGAGVDEQMRQILMAVEAMDRLLAQHCGEAGGAQRFTAAELGEQLRALYAGRAAQKEQTLTLDLTAMGETPLMADYAALSRALGNLLGNAVKYTARGGHITLRGRLRAMPGRREAVFVVEDDGAGMHPAFARRAFEPYARARETAGEDGSGMGLAIVRRLAQEMGGGVRMRSTPGRGSVFTLHVPVTAAVS
ncbi:MAG: HAMP domain-containing histidine kinase [Clostridia bacterium]|nr:HAMP domain-containing histidine kinase [Clostridia bacterium]